jgi:hypothetical protein
MISSIVVECCGENGLDDAKLLISWRPRRDLNPCYHRESTAPTKQLIETNRTERNLLPIKNHDK